MGLDTVELLISIEDEFSIEFPNEDAARLGVLGDMQDYIVQALHERGESPDESLIWQRLTQVVVKQLGVRPEEVTRSAHVVKDLHAD